MVQAFDHRAASITNPGGQFVPTRAAEHEPYRTEYRDPTFTPALDIGLINEKVPLPRA